MEKERRRNLAGHFDSRRMDKDFDLSSERECFCCFYDLHLSAASCECSPSRFSCLKHAKSLCACEPGKRFYLFRYDLDELNLLVEALEGNSNAICQWGFMDPVLASRSNASFLVKLAMKTPFFSSPDLEVPDMNKPCKSEREDTAGPVRPLWKMQGQFEDAQPVPTDVLRQENRSRRSCSGDAKFFGNIVDMLLSTGCKPHQPRSSSAPEKGKDHSFSGASQPVDLNRHDFESGNHLSWSPNCVELVALGNVIAAKGWFNAQAIFPRGKPDSNPGNFRSFLLEIFTDNEEMGHFISGFKSRVRFIDVHDPTTTCNYVSEVLNGGVLGPLFKVGIPSVYY